MVENYERDWQVLAVAAKVAEPVDEPLPSASGSSLAAVATARASLRCVSPKRCVVGLSTVCCVICDARRLRLACVTHVFCASARCERPRELQIQNSRLC